MKVGLRKNSILIIPPFWHYSFKITEENIAKQDKDKDSEKQSSKKIENQKSKIILEQNCYITYPNLLGIYLEKCKSYIDQLLQ